MFHRDCLTYSETSECNGTLPLVKNGRTCSVLVSTLTAAPFNLAWGQSVFARIAASNIKGTSPFSEPGNGDIVATFPDVPTNLKNVPAITSVTQIGLVWLEGTTFYGLPVIDYTLSYN